MKADPLRKMVATTLRAQECEPGLKLMDSDALSWLIYQGKQPFRLDDTVLTSRYASLINSVIIGIAYAGGHLDHRPSKILEQFDRFASDGDSEIKKILYYEPRALAGTVFFWQEIDKQDQKVFERLRNGLFPVRRYPINWSPELFKRALEYNLDPSIPFEPNLDSREVDFRKLFSHTNLLISAILFVASTLVASSLNQSGSVHEVIVLWFCLSAPIVGNLVGKYSGIYQLCRLSDKSPESYLNTVLEQSWLKVWLTVLNLLKWNPIVSCLMLFAVSLWSRNASR